MKKVLVVLSFICALGISAASAQSNNNNDLVGKARGVAHECISDAQAQGLEVDANAETVGICFVDGFITRVTFYASFRCHQEPCPKVMTRIVATVDFGCDGEVISNSCNQ